MHHYKASVDMSVMLAISRSRVLGKWMGLEKRTIDLRTDNQVRGGRRKENKQLKPSLLMRLSDRLRIERWGREGRTVTRTETAAESMPVPESERSLRV